MALLANINRDSKKKPQPFAAKDFAWSNEKEKPGNKRRKEMTDDEIVAALHAAFPPPKGK